MPGTESVMDVFLICIISDKRICLNDKRITQSSSMNLKDRLLMVTMASCEGTASPTGGSVLHPGVSENGLSRRLLTSVSLDRKDALIEMLVCTLDGDLYPPLEEPTGTVDPKKEKVKDEVKSFVWNHGSWEVIAEDETKEADNKGCLVNLDSADGAWLLCDGVPGAGRRCEGQAEGDGRQQETTRGPHHEGGEPGAESEL
uniref:Uncharacterized protein n=1 Tax=Oncorhynchus kisutch TaxID=8019 RepID=A0A8C7D177_ONCKI